MPDSNDRSDTIVRVCQALTNSDLPRAAQIARVEYPFRPPVRSKRRSSERQMIRVFVRDGFIDRYSGSRLILPATLRLLSIVLPDEFPAHPNWKMSESHIVFWELFPTIDHVLPVSRGGEDAESNWVTTSMLRNMAKGQWTLDELRWNLAPPGEMRTWDGLMGWFLDFVEARPDLLDHPYIARWHRAANQALGNLNLAL